MGWGARKLPPHTQFSRHVPQAHRRPAPCASAARFSVPKGAQPRYGRDAFRRGADTPQADVMRRAEKVPRDGHPAGEG